MVSGLPGLWEMLQIQTCYGSHVSRFCGPNVNGGAIVAGCLLWGMKTAAMRGDARFWDDLKKSTCMRWPGGI